MHAFITPKPLALTDLVHCKKTEYNLNMPPVEHIPVFPIKIFKNQQVDSTVRIADGSCRSRQPAFVKRDGEALCHSCSVWTQG